MECKFTDDEIVKAFGICVKAECWGDCEDMGCPAATKQGCVFYLRTDEDYEGVIQEEMLKDALDLINRQKAEIERLKSLLVEQHNTIDEIVRQPKNEAIKEFAERLLDEYDIWTESDVAEYQYVYGLVNNLVKETTNKLEENNNER